MLTTVSKGDLVTTLHPLDGYQFLHNGLPVLSTNCRINKGETLLYLGNMIKKWAWTPVNSFYSSSDRPVETVWARGGKEVKLYKIKVNKQPSLPIFLWGTDVLLFTGIRAIHLNDAFKPIGKQ